MRIRPDWMDIEEARLCRCCEKGKVVGKRAKFCEGCLDLFGDPAAIGKVGSKPHNIFINQQEQVTISDTIGGE